MILVSMKCIHQTAPDHHMNILAKVGHNSVKRQNVKTLESGPHFELVFELLYYRNENISLVICCLQWCLPSGP